MNRRASKLVAVVILGAGAAGWALTGRGSIAGHDDAEPFVCTVASVTDGDTFRCVETGADARQIRVRLSGVAARERDGSCRRDHPCPAASAEAATNALETLVVGQQLECRQVGTSYKRRAAFCRREDGTDLSCAMVQTGTVARWDRYWENHRC